MPFKALILATLFIVTSTIDAHAQVAVQGIFRTIKATERPIENVEVHNTSDKDALQIKVAADLVTFTDGKTETLTPATDLKFAPSTFILTPNSSRMLRMFKTTAPSSDVEKLYRIHLKPSAPNKVATDAVEDGKTESKIRVLTSMGILLAAAPKNIKPGVEVKRSKGKVTLTNTGNVTLHFRGSEAFCATPQGCTRLRDRYFPPNRIWTFDVPSDAEFTYFYEVYDKPASIKIKAL